MISDDVLEQGISRGIISPQQAVDLRALTREIAAASVPEPDDDEKLRFITGFNDIFVTIGIALLATALGFLASAIAGRGAAPLMLAPVAWLLAEFFTRRRRMALPSIVLLCLFAGSVFTGVLSVLLLSWDGREAFQAFSMSGNHSDAAWSVMVTGAAVVTAGAVTLHYRRFRVPITVAAGAAALTVAVVAVVRGVVPELARTYSSLIIIAVGLVVFALAMRFDLSDPARVTRRTDIAFWLHLLAAPMIVHPLVSRLVADDAAPQIGMAVAVLAIFVVLGAVAVVIDRRAMLVSGLGYAGYAFASLIKRVGVTDQAVPATLLVLGAFVLLLSAGWRPVRKILLRLLPLSLARQLPHPLARS